MFVLKNRNDRLLTLINKNSIHDSDNLLRGPLPRRHWLFFFSLILLLIRFLLFFFHLNSYVNVRYFKGSLIRRKKKFVTLNFRFYFTWSLSYNSRERWNACTLGSNIKKDWRISWNTIFQSNKYFNFRFYVLIFISIRVQLSIYKIWF